MLIVVGVIGLIIVISVMIGYNVIMELNDYEKEKKESVDYFWEGYRYLWNHYI